MAMASDTARRAGAAALVALAVLAHLAWDATHGGIPSHHLLARDDLPAVSNLWGLLLVPALAWGCMARVQQRLRRTRDVLSLHRRAQARVWMGFALALLVGAGLATAFTLGAQDVSSRIFQGVLLLALVVPLYRAECVLGFVLGLAYTFGGVLPLLIAGVVALISWVSTTVLYAAARWIGRRVGPGRRAVA